MSLSGIRMQRSDLPKSAHCFVPKACPYRDEKGTCTDIAVNKGNSDAACFRMGNRKLMLQLKA